MKHTLMSLFVVCLALGCWGQTAKMEVFNPPTSGSGYMDLFSNILTAKKTTGANAVDGIAVFLNWGQIDNGCQSPAAQCSGSQPGTYPGTGTCAEPACYWSAIDAELSGYINGPSNNGLASHGQKVNLILVPVPENDNGTTTNGVPLYVFQPNTYSNWCPICSASQPQDQSTCGFWQGDSNAPTGGGYGVWNVNVCHLTGGGSCSGSTDHSGFPVLYEAPFAEAWNTFVNVVLKHYSSSGGGGAIGTHLGYIRVGLAEGGENEPYCAITTKGIGVWPSPAGLSYDLANNINPNWYTTNATYPSCATGKTDTCQGKDAYLEGKVSQPGVDFQGYEQTIWGVLQTDLANWSTVPNVMAATNSGPLNHADTNYADVEACIFSGNPTGSSNLCSMKDYSATSGFGMEALSEWDVANAPSSCIDDWCANFDAYHGNGLNLYLQTAYPNSEPGYSIVKVTSPSSGTWEVQCAGSPAPPCAYSGTGGLLQPLFAGEPVKIGGNSGTSGTFLIASVIDGTHFTLTSSECGSNNNVCAAGTGGTVYSMDYIPDTVPFSIKNYADTLELYFCDWEYAFSSNSLGNGCAQQEPSFESAYKALLENP